MSISIDDFIVFCERTIEGMLDVVAPLSEETLNADTGLPGSNTPFQLVNHALSACRFWVEHVVCGLPTDRDRDSEFTARGTADDLRAMAAQLKASLRANRETLGSATSLHIAPTMSRPLNGEWTVGGALLHAYEEIAQHLGHLELTVDVLTNR